MAAVAGAVPEPKATEPSLPCEGGRETAVVRDIGDRSFRSQISAETSSESPTVPSTCTEDDLLEEDDEKIWAPQKKRDQQGTVIGNTSDDKSSPSSPTT